MQPPGSEVQAILLEGGDEASATLTDHRIGEAGEDKLAAPLLGGLEAGLDRHEPGLGGKQGQTMHSDGTHTPRTVPSGLGCRFRAR